MGLGILMMGGWAFHFASQWSRHPVVWSPDRFCSGSDSGGSNSCGYDGLGSDSGGSDRLVLIVVVLMAMVLIAVVLAPHRPSTQTDLMLLLHHLHLDVRWVSGESLHMFGRVVLSQDVVGRGLHSL